MPTSHHLQQQPGTESPRGDRARPQPAGVAVAFRRPCPDASVRLPCSVCKKEPPIQAAAGSASIHRSTVSTPKAGRKLLLALVGGPRRPGRSKATGTGGGSSSRPHGAAGGASASRNPMRRESRAPRAGARWTRRRRSGLLLLLRLLASFLAGRSLVAIRGVATSTALLLVFKGRRTDTRHARARSSMLLLAAAASIVGLCREYGHIVS